MTDSNVTELLPVMADRLIYIRWSDDGQHIRKWAREPFEGATAFANAGNGARENDKPPAHWAPNPRYEQPQTVEEWDWRQDGSASDDSFDRSWKRLTYAHVRADPHAPDQMALVLRGDLGRILGRLTHYTAHRKMLMEQRDAALTPSALSGDNSQSSSNAGGVDADALAEHFPTGVRGLYDRTAGGIPVQSHVGTNCTCGWCTAATDEHEVRHEWAMHVLASLSTPTAEPPPTPDRIGKDAVREAVKVLEQVQFICTNHGGQWDNDAFKEATKIHALVTPLIHAYHGQDRNGPTSATPAQEGEQ